MKTKICAELADRMENLQYSDSWGLVNNPAYIIRCSCAALLHSETCQYLCSKWRLYRLFFFNRQKLNEKEPCSSFHWLQSALPTVTSYSLDKNYTWIISFLFQCFYVPKCRMDRTDLQDEVQKVKKVLDNQLGNMSSCFTDHMSHPRDVILRRKYTLRKSLFSLLWPCLMLGGGALLVGLVKLTQCLAHLSSEMCSETAGSRLTSRYTQGKLYRLLRRSSMQSPSWRWGAKNTEL